jgi:aryl-alcohol dehydrogenase-like predicted oxidoreductase
MKLGAALDPYRENVFLACKTADRTREGARADLKRSLEHLRTDYFDLYQLHAITDLALRFTLSQSVTAALPPGEESLFRLALDLAPDFVPIGEQELTELKTLAGSLNPVFQEAG